MDASLQQLLDATSTADFDEFGWMSLDSAKWSSDDVSLELTIHQQDQSDQHWNVRCSDVRNSRIRNHCAIDHFDIASQHPLLLPHTMPLVELYFHGRPANGHAVLGQLLEVHRSVVGDWFSCDEFLNVNYAQSPLQLLVGGFGKFADGPQLLIEAYAEVLRSHGVNVSSPPARSPKWWNGVRWVEENDPLFAVIIGESYFVTPVVVAVR